MTLDEAISDAKDAEGSLNVADANMATATAALVNACAAADAAQRTDQQASDAFNRSLDALIAAAQAAKRS